MARIMVLILTVILLAIAAKPAAAFLGIDPTPTIDREGKMLGLAVNQNGALYAVGYKIPPGTLIGKTLVLAKRNPESEWVVIPSPNPEDRHNELREVVAIPGGFVAVGWGTHLLVDGSGGQASRGLILDYRNGAWDVTRIEKRSRKGREFYHYLTNVIADPLDPNTLIVVGSWGGFVNSECALFEPLFLRYNLITREIRWVRMRGVLGQFYAVTSLPDGGILATGETTGCDFTASIPLAIEVHGNAFSLVNTPRPGLQSNFYESATTPGGKVMVVGHKRNEKGQQSTIAYEYLGGGNWIDLNPPNPDPIPPDDSIAYNFFLDATTLGENLIAVGRYHAVYNSRHYEQAMLQIWNGIVWTAPILPEEILLEHNSELRGVVASPNGEIFTAGFGNPGSPSFIDQPIVLRNRCP